MFVIYNEATKKPIKVWLNNIEEIDEKCLSQAYNLSNLPFVHKWISLMPDTHAGYGMPIGGVLATTGVIIPHAVGVDIGCGMNFVATDIKVSDIKEIQTGNGNFIQAVIGDILRNIPVGFNHHKKPMESVALDKATEEFYKYEKNQDLAPNIEKAYYQIGTLGGGNHFIELQEDQDGLLCIMIHSGSRNLGKQICDYYNKVAKKLNEKWFSSVPPEFGLSFLPTDSDEGLDYINWMNLSLDFAYENRSKMMDKTKEILDKYMNKFTDISYSYQEEINCHHNYAAIEHHFGKNVWVHRKGATRVRDSELAVIPGAMGSYSYVVRGLGNEMSFCSSSHGAGRKFSRKSATENFSVQEVIEDLKKQNVVLGKQNKKDVAEESRFAYKDIDEVMECQKDLVEPIRKLKTIGVVKG